MKMRPIHTRLPPWWVLAVVIVGALVVVVGYRLNRERKWTISALNGRSVCHVQEGWNEQEVFVHCGPRSGRGVQPKVTASGTGSELRMCSAPGDVYGSKAVLYGCDGKVLAVENMPVQGFIYPSRWP